MRVLFVCEGDARTHDSWSGVSCNVMRHLEAAGHDVTPVDVDLYGLNRGLTAVRTAALSRRRWWVRYHLSELGFEARSQQCARKVRAMGGGFDVVLQVGATFAVPRDVGAPVVMYCDSSIELARAGSATGYSDATFLHPEEIAGIRARETAVYWRASRILTMSHRLRSSFIEDFGLPPDRLVTVHCGANVSVEEPEAPRQDQGPPTILFSGRDFERKGGDLLVRAFRRVRAAVPDARLTMVGSLPKIAPEPGVEFIPFLSRDTEHGRAGMDEAYRSATVFCVPTRFDAFGTAYVEAMLYGLPCVGPRAWAVPEIISDGLTGTVVRPEDPDALADALIPLVTDRSRAREMGLAGRARALRKFTWPRVVARICDVLEEVVPPHEPTGGDR